MPLQKACVVRGNVVCANPVHTGQRSDWWETTEQKRVRVQVPRAPHHSTPSQEITAALHPSPKSPAGFQLGSVFHTTKLPSEVLGFPIASATFPLQVQDFKTSHYYQPQTTASSLVEFPKPCPHLCKYSLINSQSSHPIGMLPDSQQNSA